MKLLTTLLLAGAALLFGCCSTHSQNSAYTTPDSLGTLTVFVAKAVVDQGLNVAIEACTLQVNMNSEWTAYLKPAAFGYNLVMDYHSESLWMQWIMRLGSNSLTGWTDEQAANGIVESIHHLYNFCSKELLRRP